MQGKIHFGKSLEESIHEAVSLLEDNGFIVIDKTKLKEVNIKKASDLVDYFYSLLQFCNPDRLIHYTYSKKDLKIAKELIKSRQVSSGAGSRQRALSEAVEIVRCVVENEVLFGFKSPLKSFDCFGQGAMKWVTDKSISIINMEDAEKEEADLNLYMGNLYVEQEKEAINALNDSTIDRLKDILGGLDNGKT